MLLAFLVPRNVSRRTHWYPACYLQLCGREQQCVDGHAAVEHDTSLQAGVSALTLAISVNRCLHESAFAAPDSRKHTLDCFFSFAHSHPHSPTFCPVLLLDGMFRSLSICGNAVAGDIPTWLFTLTGLTRLALPIG